MLPVLRSEAQARLLAALLLGPDDPPPTLTGLASRARVPYSTAQREIDLLEEAALVTSERFAGSRVVRPNEASPIMDDLRSLLMKTHGPIQMVAEVLRGLKGVEEAFIFGSWAARYLGESGPTPADVDVLVVGTPSLTEVDDAAVELGERLGREVQMTVLTPDEWRAAGSGFVRTVRNRPRVQLRVSNGD